MTPGSVKVKISFFFRAAVCVVNLQAGSRWTVNAQLAVFVNVAVSVTSDGDRCFPGAHEWVDAVDEDRCAENGAVEEGADGAVRAFPHFLEVVLFNAGSVWRDCCTLDADAIFFDRFCSVHGHLVVCFVAIFKTEIVVFGFQIHIWQDQFVFDPGPEDACHFVAVHFDERRGHFDFFHR